MKLIMLGTGNAAVTECYNTCFVIEDEGKYFLVDSGGGNTLLKQLKKVGIDRREIHEVFITHRHCDHITGMVWLIRNWAQSMSEGKYQGEVHVYGHEEVINILVNFTKLLFPDEAEKILDKQLFFIVVEDGEKKVINGKEVTFFDIGSTKAKQFGFSMELNEGKRLTCCGDEPYKDREEKYVRGCDWLLTEAFCLYSDKDKFHPYEKSHSTVKDACQLAEELQVKNLVLYHTEESDLVNRKAKYTAEGKEYFSGNLWVPDDLESIEL